MKLIPSISNRNLRSLAEALWLAAVCLIPIFFNPYSKRCFDPDRAALLRSLALFLAACLGAHLWARWRANLTSSETSRRGESLDLIASRGILAAVGFFCFSYIVSSILSLSPKTSISGAYDRGGGLLTVLAGLTLFFAVKVFLKTRAQLERALFLMTAVSIPVAVYAVCQALGCDSIRWSNYFKGRIGSSLGNPIFLGGFMILSFMVTLRQIIVAARVFIAGTEEASRTGARLTLFILAAVCQVGAILLSGSRGPILALVTGLLVFALMLCLRQGKLKLALLFVGAPLVGALLMVVGQKSFERIKAPQQVTHLFRLLDAEEGNSRVRVLIWRSVAKLAVSWLPLSDAEGSPDRYGTFRPLVGYGPETIQLVFDRYYPPELGRLESRSSMIDRCHNEGWEALVSRGWIGLVAYLGLFLSLVAFAVHQLGLTPTRLHRRKLLLSCIAAGMLGGLLLVAFKGPEFAMLGLFGGLVMGLLLYPLAFQRQVSRSHRADFTEDLTVAAILGALVAFFIETQFGFVTVTTTCWFWLLAGFLIVAPACFRSAPGGEAQDLEIFGRKGLSLYGALFALMAVSLVHTLSSVGYVRMSVWRQLALALVDTSQPGGLLLRPAVFVIGATLAWMLPFVFLSSSPRTAGTLRWPGLLAFFAPALLLPAFFAFWIAWLQARCTEMPLEPVSNRLLRAEAIGLVLWVVLAICLLLVFLVAWRIRRIMPDHFAVEDHESVSGRLVAALFVLAVVVAWFGGWQGVWADRFSQEAEFAASRQTWPLAMAAGLRAHRIAPDEPVYLANLGRYSFRSAVAATSPREADKLGADAERYLRLALFCAPWRATYPLSLADFYQWRASEAVWPGVVQVYADGAIHYYESALRLAPYNPIYRNNLAKLYLRVLHQPERARDVLQATLQLDPVCGSTHQIMGDCLFALGQERGVGGEKLALFRRAQEHYRLAFQYANPWELEEQTDSYLNMARLCVELNDAAGFAAQSEKARKSAVGDDVEWVDEELERLERRLARLETPPSVASKRKLKHSSFRRLSPPPEREGFRKTAAPAM